MYARVMPVIFFTSFDLFLCDDVLVAILERCIPFWLGVVLLAYQPICTIALCLLRRNAISVLSHDQCQAQHRMDYILHDTGLITIIHTTTFMIELISTDEITIHIHVASFCISATVTNVCFSSKVMLANAHPLRKMGQLLTLIFTDIHNLRRNRILPTIFAFFVWFSKILMIASVCYLSRCSIISP